MVLSDLHCIVLILLITALYCSKLCHCPIVPVRAFAGVSLSFMPARARTSRAFNAESAQEGQKGPLHVEAPLSFDLGVAVSSYGFFMLPPNQWVKVGLLTTLHDKIYWL